MRDRRDGATVSTERSGYFRHSRTVLIRTFISYFSLCFVCNIFILVSTSGPFHAPHWHLLLYPTNQPPCQVVHLVPGLRVIPGNEISPAYSHSSWCYSHFDWYDNGRNHGTGKDVHQIPINKTQSTYPMIVTLLSSKTVLKNSKRSEIPWGAMVLQTSKGLAPITAQKGGTCWSGRVLLLHKVLQCHGITPDSCKRE